MCQDSIYMPWGAWPKASKQTIAEWMVIFPYYYILGLIFLWNEKDLRNIFLVLTPLILRISKYSQRKISPEWYLHDLTGQVYSFSFPNLCCSYPLPSGDSCSSQRWCVQSSFITWRGSVPWLSYILESVATQICYIKWHNTWIQPTQSSHML